MAYTLQTLKRKDGSITYSIFEVSRVPNGNGKQNTRCVEKFNSSQIEQNAHEFALERLEYWKNKARREASELFSTIKDNMK